MARFGKISTIIWNFFKGLLASAMKEWITTIIVNGEVNLRAGAPPAARVRRALMSTMGQEVKRRRRELHLTQEDVANLAGVSPSLVRFIEHDKPTVRLDKYADVLNVLGLELTVRVKTT